MTGAGSSAAEAGATTSGTACVAEAGAVVAAGADDAAGATSSGTACAAEAGVAAGAAEAAGGAVSSGTGAAVGAAEAAAGGAADAGAGGPGFCASAAGTAEAGVQDLMTSASSASALPASPELTHFHMSINNLRGSMPAEAIVPG